MGSYGVSALTLPKSDILEWLDGQAQMRIISFIEDEEVIKKVLKHLGALVGQRETPTQGQCPAHGISNGLFQSQYQDAGKHT